MAKWDRGGGIGSVFTSPMRAAWITAEVNKCQELVLDLRNSHRQYREE